MRLTKRRLQFRIDQGQAEEVERLAQLRRRDLSDTIAHLVGRGLDREAHRELSQLSGLIATLSEHVEQLQAQVEALEAREAIRFRLLLGHQQQHQAMSTECLQLQREGLTQGYPARYAEALEAARRQVSEDARTYRASLAAGGTVAHPQALPQAGGAA